MHTVIGIGKAIVAPVLSVNENDHLRLLGTTTFMCAFSVYVWGVVDSPGEAELPPPSFSTASGDCRRSCMLFTRSSTRQVPISFPFIDIRSITMSLLMRLLLVNSCSYVRAMLNTRFIYLGETTSPRRQLRCLPFYHSEAD